MTIIHLLWKPLSLPCVFFYREVDGKVYKAFVKKKDEARKQYDQAVQSGISAAHIGMR